MPVPFFPAQRLTVRPRRHLSTSLPGPPLTNPPASETALLAVDLGLRTGLAGFRRDGLLAWYRSQHYATHATLRRAVHGLLNQLPALELLVLEGGGPVGEIWTREATRRGLVIRSVCAEEWRTALWPSIDLGAGSKRLKQAADALARQLIDASPASRPTSLRHDAAEAILIGHWAVKSAGWLDGP